MKTPHKKPAVIRKIKSQNCCTKQNHTPKQSQTKILANYLGKEYAVHIEIVGEPLYRILVFRLKKEEQVLYQHPSYEKIEKLGVDMAIDAMDLTFLIKWNASCKQGLYGITQEVENQKELEAYIVSLIEDKFA